MQKSIKSDVLYKSSVAPAGNRTTSTNGTGVDLRGYGAALAIISSATITDGVHTPKLHESADNSTFTDVAAGDLDGAFAALISDAVQQVGYKGKARYLRIVVTVTGSPATGGIYTAGVLRSEPTYAPVA